VKRRTFLMSAVGAAALPAWGREGALSPSDRITVACIGTGWQGMNNVASFLEEPGAQVVAVCDVDTEHLEQARQAVDAKYGSRDCKA
jgi:ornithine cyclodeaminase/alanine dehydrogenase-like protein (mu-crystallin family)